MTHNDPTQPDLEMYVPEHWGTPRGFADRREAVRAELTPGPRLSRRLPALTHVVAIAGCTMGERAPGTGPYRHIIRDETGRTMGYMTAAECWDWLRRIAGCEP